MALDYMNVSERAEWKTVKNLTSFRQALREDTVNERGFSDRLKQPLTKKVFDEFMKRSRDADFVHHHGHTF